MDLLTLVAHLHHDVLITLEEELGAPCQGLSVASRQLRMSSRLRRRCRELDIVYGWLRHLTVARAQRFRQEITEELVASKVIAGEAMPPTTGRDTNIGVPFVHSVEDFPVPPTTHYV